MTSCREVSSWIDTFVDGELPLDRAVDTECHIARCPNCTERLRFERAYRASLKHSVRSDGVASQSLRERLESAMIAERESARIYACTPMAGANQAMRVRLREPSSPVRALVRTKRKSVNRELTAADIASPSWGPLSWRSLLPVAAAAAGAILWAGIQNNTQTPVVHSNVADIRLSELDRYLDLMVSRHQGTSAQAQAIRFSPAERLDPPFQLPPFQDMRQGSPSYPMPTPTVSDSLAALRGASSAYQVKGHRVTFFAYEAGMAPLRARLQARSFRGHVVFVGKRQGYSVATVEEGPVGYAMTSDLPEIESAELIASAVDARVPH